jgi:hypothetical protein
MADCLTTLPQKWAAALYAHPGCFDGIAYRSRHDDDTICYAFFDRPPACVQKSALSDEKNLSDCDWFWQEMIRYRIGLAPTA